MIRHDLMLKKYLILVLTVAFIPFVLTVQFLSRVSFQIYPKMTISSFEKTFDHQKHLCAWNTEQILRDYGYHPLNGQMMRILSCSKLQNYFPKMRDVGQRPFGTFPKIHPFGDTICPLPSFSSWNLK